MRKYRAVGPTVLGGGSTRWWRLPCYVATHSCDQASTRASCRRRPVSQRFIGEYGRSQVAAEHGAEVANFL